MDVNFSSVSKFLFFFVYLNYLNVHLHLVSKTGAPISSYSGNLFKNQNIYLRDVFGVFADDCTSGL